MRTFYIKKYFEERNYDNIIANLGSRGFQYGERSFVFLDEIQNIHEIVKVVKYLYDHYHIKFFLTGSSSFYPRNLFSESLAGRKTVYELFPLSFEVYSVFKEKRRTVINRFKEKKKNLVRYKQYCKDYEGYLEFGGFPTVVLEKVRSQKI